MTEATAMTEERGGRRAEAATTAVTEEEATSEDVISESGATAEQVAEAADIAVDETPADAPVIGGTEHVHAPETGEDA